MNACSACGAGAPTGKELCDACVAQGDARSTVAGFVLTRKLGAGRFGTSWLGEAPEGYTVIKLLHAKPESPAAARGFREAAAKASLVQAPTVAHLQTAGSLPDGRLFLIFEYGAEQSLADVLRAQARLSPPRALDVCAEIALGLHAGHQRGILHRDLKAANVALWQDESGAELVRVLDLPTNHLCMAAGLREAGPLPLSSAATASPEEARGEPIDLRADIYALGVLLFQSLTGRLPVTGMTPQELFRSHREHPPLSLRDAGRKLPQLEEVVARLLRKRPDERPGTAREVAEALRALAPQVEDAQHPRLARAAAPPEEFPLPAAAPLLTGERLQTPQPASNPQLQAAPPAAGAIVATDDLEATDADDHQTPIEVQKLQPALDPDKTPPGAIAAPPPNLPSDAPTPPQGSILPTPARSTPVSSPATSARPAPPPPHQHLPPVEAAPKKTVATAEFDPDRTPPDPVLAAVEHLPHTPEWIPEQAGRVAKLEGLEEKRLPPLAKAADQEADEEPTPTGKGAPPPERVLRRRRGKKVAFSASAERSDDLEKQLVRYGIGLIVLLALLVFAAVKIL